MPGHNIDKIASEWADVAVDLRVIPVEPENSRVDTSYHAFVLVVTRIWRSGTVRASARVM